MPEKILRTHKPYARRADLKAHRRSAGVDREHGGASSMSLVLGAKVAYYLDTSTHTNTHVTSNTLIDLVKKRASVMCNSSTSLTGQVVLTSPLPPPYQDFCRFVGFIFFACSLPFAFCLLSDTRVEELSFGSGVLPPPPPDSSQPNPLKPCLRET